MDITRRYVIFAASCTFDSSLMMDLCSDFFSFIFPVVNNTPRPIGNDSAAVIERQRIQDTAEGMLRTVLMTLFQLAGESLDHVPPVMFEFVRTLTRLFVIQLGFTHTLT